MDPDDVTPAAGVQQTQQSKTARSELEPLLTVNTNVNTKVNTNSNSRRNTVNTNSEPRVDTNLKVGRNIIKTIALILFLITLVITSHVIRDHFTEDSGTNEKIKYYQPSVHAPIYRNPPANKVNLLHNPPNVHDPPKKTTKIPHNPPKSYPDVTIYRNPPSNKVNLLHNPPNTTPKMTYNHFTTEPDSPIYYHPPKNNPPTTNKNTTTSTTTVTPSSNHDLTMTGTRQSPCNDTIFIRCTLQLVCFISGIVPPDKIADLGVKNLVLSYHTIISYHHTVIPSYLTILTILTILGF